jgi:hypothetical protein
MLPFVGLLLITLRRKLEKVQTLIKKETEEFTIMTTSKTKKKDNNGYIKRQEKRDLKCHIAMKRTTICMSAAQ